MPHDSTAKLRQSADGHFESTCRRFGWWLALGGFVLTRLVVLIAAWTAPQDRSQTGPDWWSDWPLLRWDAGHYLGILREGYPATINDTVAFFPAYPLTAAALRELTGISDEAALVLSANTAALLAAALVFAWARRAAGDAAAVRCVWLLGAYPSSLFLSVGYTEGLFLLCTVAALLAMQRGWVPVALLAAAVASATRPPGAIVSLVVVLWLWQRDDWRWRPATIARLCAAGLVSVSGLLAHQGYLAARYGRTDAFTAAQKTWRARTVKKPLRDALTLRPVLSAAWRPFNYTLSGRWDRLAAHRTWDGFLNVLLLLIAFAGLWRPGPFPRVVYLLAILTFLMAWLPDPAGGARLYGISRYQLIAIPCFVRLAQWRAFRSTLCLAAWLALWLTLQTIWMRGFVDWQPVG